MLQTLFSLNCCRKSLILVVVTHTLNLGPSGEKIAWVWFNGFPRTLPHALNRWIWSTRYSTPDVALTSEKKTAPIYRKHLSTKIFTVNKERITASDFLFLLFVNIVFIIFFQVSNTCNLILRYPVGNREETAG